jgi:hypothetical protein
MPLNVGIAAAAGSLKNIAEPIALGYRVNLIRNPSFEVGTTSWTSVAGATLSRVTSEGLYGSAALQVVNASGSAAQFGSSGTGNMLPLIAGMSQYTISAYVKLAPGASTANYFLRHLQYENETGSSVVAGNVGIQSLSVTGNWVRLSGTFTKSTIANFALIRVVTSSTGSGDTFFVDGVQLEGGNTVTPYFDGSTGGFWVGTENNSISGASPFF